MRTARKAQAACKSQNDGWETPLLWLFGAFLAGGGSLFFLIYSLCQPSVYPNPGVMAYQAPAATRLIPLPRKSDAPPLIDLPPEPSVGLLPAEVPPARTALAQATASDPPAKREMHPSNRKHPRGEPRAYDQRGLEYTQQWNFGYHDWSNNRRWVGGPRSWF